MRNENTSGFVGDEMALGIENPGLFRKMEMDAGEIWFSPAS
jgi:hypothetical protein